MCPTKKNRLDEIIACPRAVKTDEEIAVDVNINVISVDKDIWDTEDMATINFTSGNLIVK